VRTLDTVPLRENFAQEVLRYGTRCKGSHSFIGTPTQGMHYGQPKLVFILPTPGDGRLNRPRSLATYLTTTVDTARDLRVVLNSQLIMSAQVGTVCQSTYNYLRQLRPVVRALSTEARKTVVQAFVSSRLDYCNSLLSGVTDTLVQRLQAAQNAAARLVTGIRRCEHITPV